MIALKSILDRRGRMAKIFALGFDMARFLAPGAARWWGGNRLAFVLLAFEQNQRSDAVPHRFVNNSVTLPPHTPPGPWVVSRRGARAGGSQPAPLLVLSCCRSPKNIQRTVNRKQVIHRVTPLLAQRITLPGNSYFWRTATQDATTKTLNPHP